MNSRVLVALSLLLTSCSAFDICQFSREEFYPCTGCTDLDGFQTAGCLSPSANKYTIHATRFQSGSSGFFECFRRKDGQILQDIEDLGVPEVKFLFSPGAEKSPEMDYVSQTLVEYNVQCAAGKMAYLQFNKFDLEEKNCNDGSMTKCRDYIEVDAGVGGVTEFCGNESQSFTVGTGSFTLKFRSSFLNDYPGFRIFMTCFSGNQLNQEIDRSSCSNTGGPLVKHDTFELVDLSAPSQPDRGVVAPLSTKFTPTKITLTGSDLRTLTSLSNSLFEVALSQARRKLTSYPPASYFRNGPNDVTDPSQLNEPVDINPATLTPFFTFPPPPPPSLPPDIFVPIDKPDVIAPAIQRKRRKRLAPISAGSLAKLDTSSTLQAVRFENACNPIVRAVTNSYLAVAQRLEPAQLFTARQEFQRELELAADQPLEDLALQPDQDSNLQPQLHKQ